MPFPVTPLRLLWLCALACCAACSVDVAVPPGKACDDAHPCSAGRICSPEGVCVEPGSDPVPGEDGGVDAGLPDGGDPVDAGTCEDEPRVGMGCDAGLGECARTGQFSCATGSLQCDAVVGEELPEVCDGLDNDCDGLTDDDLTPPVCLNKGVCAGAAVPVCQGASGFSACSYGDDYQMDETRCDGLDNDCDGIVDEIAGCLFTLGGTNSAAGFRDGAPDVARFSFPSTIAADAAGNLYVADTANHAIRKIDTTGAVTTLAGSGKCGNQIGPAAQSELCDPLGVAVNPAGTVVYFSDSTVNRIRKIENGTVSEVAGAGIYGFQDGPAANARFRSPAGLFLQPNGDLLIADLNNDRIRRYVVATQTVLTLAGSTSGNSDGSSFTNAQFDEPYDVIGDSQGNLYVTELGGDRIRKLSSDGLTVSTLAGSPTGGSGYTEDIGTLAEFSDPAQLALDEAGGYLYVTDTLNNRVRAVPLDGASSTVLMVGASTNGSSLGKFGARLDNPLGLVFSKGALFVGDYTHAIKKISLTGPAALDRVYDYAGSSVPNQSQDGTLATGRMAFPWHFSVEAASGDVLFVEDETNLVRRWGADGTFSTVAGDAINHSIGNDNGPVAASTFDDPMDVLAGTDGRIYVVEEDNDDVRVIDPVAGTVALFAGSASGSSGNSNGALTSARFSSPQALAWWTDGQGHDLLFVGEEDNRVIRKIDVTTGQVTTYAGTMGLFGATDGPPGTGRFRHITDIAVDPATGELYVSDSNAIRHVATTGNVTTVSTSFPDDLLGVDLDGPNTVVAVGAQHVWQVELGTGAKTLFFDPQRSGVQDGYESEAGVGLFTDVKAYPDHYLLLDYWGRRFRQLWK